MARRPDGRVDVRVDGELDLATGRQLERTVAEACCGGCRAALDLREVAFIDCAGLRSVRRVLAYGDGRIARTSPAVDRLLALMSETRGAGRLAA